MDKTDMNKIFREKLAGYTEEPSPFLWDTIQADLAGRYRKRRMAWYGLSAVAALLVLAFIAGWHFNQSGEQDVYQVAGNEAVNIEDQPALVEREIVTPTEAGIEAANLQDNGKPLLASAITEDEKGQPGPEELLRHYEEERKAVFAFSDLKPITRIEAEGLSAVVEKPVLLSVTSDHLSGGDLSLNGMNRIIQNIEELAQTGRDHAVWEMGINVAPAYSSYTTKHSSAYAGNMSYEASDGSGNIGGGLSVRYRTGRRWSLESGIYYAQSSLQTGGSPQLFGKRSDSDYMAAPVERLYFNSAVDVSENQMAINSTAGVIEFNNLPVGAEIAASPEISGAYSNSLFTSGELDQVFEFMEIPLFLRYRLTESKIELELVGGINAGLVVGNRAYIDNEYGLQNIGKTSDISTLNIAGTLGFGLNYPLGKNLSFALEPRLNYYFHSINRNPEISFTPYRTGVYTGLYYAF